MADIRGGAWRLVGGLGVEEDAPAAARAPATSCGRRPIRGSASARISATRRSASTRISSDIVAVIEIENLDRRDPDRPLLRRHGGDRRRRPRPRAHQPAGLSRRVRADRRTGDLRSGSAGHRRKRCAQARQRAPSGYGIPANPMPSDTAPEDQAWAAPRRMPQPLQGVLHQAEPVAEPAMPRSYIYARRPASATTSASSISARSARAGRPTRSTRATIRTSPIRRRCSRSSTRSPAHDHGAHDRHRAASACSAAHWRTG